MKYAANCLVIKEDKILLGWKKRGFGAGLLTGIGGKKNPEETYADAAARELFEESGVVVDPQKIELAAVVEYVFAGESAWIVHEFVAREFVGEPKETEEMSPTWFAVNDIPFAKMWQDNGILLPKIIAGEKFFARYHYDSKDADNMVNYEHRDLIETDLL